MFGKSLIEQKSFKSGFKNGPKIADEFAAESSSEFFSGLSYRELPERAPSAPIGPMYSKAAELPPEDMFQKEKPRPPKFKTPMKPLMGLAENDPAHFECRLVPVGDPDMLVEWFKDGVLLKHGQSV